MANFNLTAPTTVAQTLNTGEFGIVGTNASIQALAFPLTMNGTSYLLTNGAILGFGTAVNAANGIRIEIIVGENGSIQSNGDGILADVTQVSRIINHGDISGTSNALQLTADNQASIGVNHDVVNTGRLSSTSGSAVLLEINDLGFTEISNSGVISSASTAIDNSATTGGLTLIRNTGQILAGQDLDTGGNVDHAFLGGASTDYLINQGFISGEIDLGAGADLYNGNGGTVSGLIKGGAGDDTLKGGANADEMEGGAQADLLVGREGDDVLQGDAGFDTLVGGSGNDTLLGGAGDDTLLGQAGDDQLDGGLLDDLLDAGAGDDVLVGDDGNDVLRGRAGEDLLSGGLGRDALTGGADADDFLFRTTAEAGLGANRDIIQDFEPDVDRIVVTGMTPGVFDFIGTAAFSAPDQIRVIETATGSTIVQFNTDADLAAEAEIRVAGVTGLTADDFAL